MRLDVTGTSLGSWQRRLPGIARDVRSLIASTAG